jgi:CheY-like chemotaxis protein
MTSVALALHILLAEDSPVVALDMLDMLERNGFRVTHAATVGGALAALRDDGFDGAIIDMNLREQDCAPVAERLRALAIPFVLATGYSEAETIAAALGARSVLMKPFLESDLLAVLRFLE